MKLAPCSQEHSSPQTLITPETSQVTADNKPVGKLTSSTSILTMDGKPVLKLAGAGMTEFHKFGDLPVALRTKIMEVNMYQDPVVSDPRIIKIYMECMSSDQPNISCTCFADIKWAGLPAEDDCYSDHDPLPKRDPVTERLLAGSSDEDEEEVVEYNMDRYRHTHIYPDHVNFTWKIDPESASEVLSSHKPLIPYYFVSKECRSTVKRFVIAQMGRRTRAFRSPELRWLPLSPTQDIFKIECPRAWEPVNEWGSDALRAARDALFMNNFMVDFNTFHGLVEPALRKKDEYLLYLSNKEPTDYFQGESSMHAVFKNAKCIYVVAATDQARIATYRDVDIWTKENVQKEAVPDLQSETKEVLESVWDEKNTEFNGLRNGDGNLPMVLCVTVPEKKIEAGNTENAHEDGPGDDQ